MIADADGGARSSPWLQPAANMGNAGSMDSQQTDFRAHNVPLKLPMPEPGELEERFAIVLVSAQAGGRGDPGPRPGAQRTRAPSPSPGAGSAEREAVETWSPIVVSPPCS